MGYTESKWLQSRAVHPLSSLPAIMKILWTLLKILVLATAIYIRLIDPLKFHQEYTNNLANTLINFVIFVAGANLLLQIVEYYFSRNQSTASNIRLGLRNIYYILVALAFLMVGLSFLGIDYRTLFTSLSIVAAAIAIVTKDFITEILSGIILSFSKRILINDYVKIGNMRGRILDMGLYKLTFLNDDDDIIFIPNSTVYRSEIINYTQSDQRRISIDFQLLIPQVENFEKVEQELSDMLREFHNLIEPNTFVVRIMNLSKDVVDFKLLFTSTSSEPEMIRNLRRTAIRKVLNYVKSKSPSPGGLKS